MNHRTRAWRRRWRARSRPARTTAALAATLAVLAAACGSLPSSAGGSPTGGSASPSTVAYSHCMRFHGVPNYPDPNSRNTMPDGLPKISVQQLRVSSSKFQAAQRACRHVLPNGGQATQSASQQLLRDGLKYARCMRAHGVPNWPDPARSNPTAMALGAPSYMYQMGGLENLDGRSFPPWVTTTMRECLHLTHLAGSQVPDWSG